MWMLITNMSFDVVISFLVRLQVNNLAVWEYLEKIKNKLYRIEVVSTQTAFWNKCHHPLFCFLMDEIWI